MSWSLKEYYEGLGQPYKGRRTALQRIFADDFKQFAHDNARTLKALLQLETREMYDFGLCGKQVYNNWEAFVDEWSYRPVPASLKALGESSYRIPPPFLPGLFEEIDKRYHDQGTFLPSGYPVGTGIQGIACTHPLPNASLNPVYEDRWFLTFNSHIAVVTADVITNEPVGDHLDSKFSEIPAFFKSLGCNHFSACCWYGGFLYVALEGGPLAFVLRYTNSLDYLDAYVLFTGFIDDSPVKITLPLSQKKASWCAINPVDGLLYSSICDHPSCVYVYDISACVPLTETQSRIMYPDPRSYGGWLKEELSGVSLKEAQRVLVPRFVGCLFLKDAALPYLVQGGAFDEFGNLYLMTRYGAKGDYYGPGWLKCFDTIAGNLIGSTEIPAGVDIELEGFCFRPGVPGPSGHGDDLAWELSQHDETVSAPGRLHLAVHNLDAGANDFEIRHYDWVAPLGADAAPAGTLPVSKLSELAREWAVKKVANSLGIPPTAVVASGALLGWAVDSFVQELLAQNPAPAYWPKDS